MVGTRKFRGRSARRACRLPRPALIDLHNRTIINEFPFQQWSAAGHVMTRNPLKFAATGRTITMWVAADNGEETAGTQIYTWQATTAG